MKHKKVIQIIAETYYEEQYILLRFPEAWWDDRSGETVFSIPLEQEEQVHEVMKEYKERIKNGAT